MGVHYGQVLSSSDLTDVRVRKMIQAPSATSHAERV
jgi:hypothetical protein